MEGNRWAFPYMLRGSVYMVFCILTAFGAIGYLRYLNIEKLELMSSFPFCCLKYLKTVLA